MRIEKQSDDSRSQPPSAFGKLILVERDGSALRQFHSRFQLRLLPATAARSPGVAPPELFPSPAQATPGHQWMRGAAAVACHWRFPRIRARWQYPLPDQASDEPNCTSPVPGESPITHKSRLPCRATSGASPIRRAPAAPPPPHSTVDQRPKPTVKRPRSTLAAFKNRPFKSNISRDTLLSCIGALTLLEHHQEVLSRQTTFRRDYSEPTNCALNFFWRTAGG